MPPIMTPWLPHTAWLEVPGVQGRVARRRWTRERPGHGPSRARYLPGAVVPSIRPDGRVLGQEGGAWHRMSQVRTGRPRQLGQWEFSVEPLTEFIEPEWGLLEYEALLAPEWGLEAVGPLAGFADLAPTELIEYEALVAPDLYGIADIADPIEAVDWGWDWDLEVYEPALAYDPELVDWGWSEGDLIEYGGIPEVSSTTEWGALEYESVAMPDIPEGYTPTYSSVLQPMPDIIPSPVEATGTNWLNIFKGTATVLTAGAKLAGAVLPLFTEPTRPTIPGYYPRGYPTSPTYAPRPGYPTAIPPPAPVGGIPRYPGISPFVAPTAPTRRRPAPGIMGALTQPGPLGVPLWGWLAGGAAVLLMAGAGGTRTVRRRRRRK